MEETSHFDWKALYDGLAGQYAALESIYQETRRKLEAVESETAKRETRSFLEGLLPVADDLERIVAAVNNQCDSKVITDGARMVIRAFDRFFASKGVVPVDCSPGSPFDPKVHEAVSTVRTNSLPEGMIAEQVRAGYLFNGKLLRAARVIVSSGN